MKTLLSFLISVFCFSALAAVSFDAVDDICATPTIIYSNQTPISCSAWIFVAGAHQGAAGSQRGAVIESIALTPTRGWRLTSNTSDSNNGTNTVTFLAQFATAAVTKCSSAQSVPQSVWTHIASTWNGTVNSSGVTLYVNGTSVGSFFTVEGSGAWVPVTNCTFHSGSRVGPAQGFNGQICEMAVWTNVLTAAQVATLSKSRTARMPLMFPTGLVGYWPMDGGANSTAITAANCIYDLSGKGNHASPTNSPTWKASPLGYP